MPERPLSHKIAFWCCIFLASILITSKFFRGPFYTSNEQILGTKLPNIKLTSSFNFTFESSGLSSIVQNQIKESNGHYSIYIEDLNTEEKYGYNETEIFPAASLYKLFLIAAVVEKIENKELKTDDTVKAERKHLEEVFGGLDFGYTDAPSEIEYTIDEALTRVGRISDNFAAIMLAEKIGWDNVQIQANKIGTHNTTIKSPINTTAFDVAIFFKKLYLGQIVSASGSQRIMEYLGLNQLNNRLPARLPEGVKVVHKTGELSQVRHDAGIVYCCSVPEISGEIKAEAQLNNHPYVVVVMSKDLTYEDDGIETIAELSKEIYNYFKSK